MKKINRGELRRLINESMHIKSRDDASVDAFIDKIERISTGNAEPMLVIDTIYNMNPSQSMGHFLLTYIRQLPSMADEYPVYRQRAQRIKDVLLAFLFALNDRHGALADSKTSTNAPYALDFVEKALSVLRSIDHNPRYN